MPGININNVIPHAAQRMSDVSTTKPSLQGKLPVSSIKNSEPSQLNSITNEVHSALDNVSSKYSHPRYDNQVHSSPAETTAVGEEQSSMLDDPSSPEALKESNGMEQTRQKRSIEPDPELPPVEILEARATTIQREFTTDHLIRPGDPHNNFVDKVTLLNSQVQNHAVAEPLTAEQASDLAEKMALIANKIDTALKMMIKRSWSGLSITEPMNVLRRNALAPAEKAVFDKLGELYQDIITTNIALNEIFLGPIG
jgi:hypothetical protein